MLKVIFQTLPLKIGLFGHFFLNCEFVFLSSKLSKPNTAKQVKFWFTLAKRAPRVSEPSAVTQIKQTKQIKHGPCERSELREWAIQAQFSHTKLSELQRTSRTSEPSRQASQKRSLRKPSKPNCCELGERVSRAGKQAKWISKYARKQ